MFARRAAMLVLLGLVLGAQAPPAKPAPDKVVLALHWLTQCQFAGYYVALEKGYFRDEGIDLSIRAGASDSNPIQLVSLGAAQFGTRWLADLTSAVDKGSPVISVAQVFGSSGLVMVARADAGIRRPRDFANKRVGIWFSGNEVQFYALMAQEGVEATSLKIATMQTSLQPFFKRELDVINAMTYNELPRLLERMKREELRIFDFGDYGLNFPGDVLFARTSLVKSNPGLVRRMVRASLRGWQDALNDPEGATRIVLKHDRTGKLDAKHQSLQMQEVARLIRLDGRRLGSHAPADIERVIAVLTRQKLLTRKLVPDDVFTNAFLP